MDINSLLRIMVTKGASDLHLKAGSFPYLRLNGELVPMTEYGKISMEDSLMLAFSMMNDKQKLRFKDMSVVDIGYGVTGIGRFRVNVFQQRGSVSAAIRAIPSHVPSFEDLKLPKVLEKIAQTPRGLILVTGTTGSGKSTTLAAIINYINEHMTRHIITIEDPIEFSHRDRMSIVTQREISVDASTFATALRSSLRQDPDVILVGEMRDLETVETALAAAETGHLVISTLHTLDALETITRILTVFPNDQQRQIRLQLAMILRAVISMRLIKRSDASGRVPAVEVLVATEYIRNCILEADKTALIRDAIAAGTSQYGMQTFDQSIYEHFKSKRITYDEALAYASNPDELKLRIQGITTTKAAAIEAMEKELTTRAR